MGLLRKLFGGEGDGAAQHEAELREFLQHGTSPATAGTQTRNAGDEDAVTDEDVAAAFGAQVVGREIPLRDDDVVNLDLHLRGRSGTVSVYICNHVGRAGMAVDDESCWRDTGVARELPGLGDSAFITKEGTLFARLADRYTIQVMAPEPGENDEDAGHCRALARSILDRLDRGR